MSYPFDEKLTPEEYRRLVEKTAEAASESSLDALTQVAHWFSVFSGIAESAIGFEFDGSKKIEIALPNGDTKWVVTNTNRTNNVPRQKDEGRSPYVTVETLVDDRRVAMVGLSEARQIAGYTPAPYENGVPWFDKGMPSKPDGVKQIVERVGSYVQPLFEFLTQSADGVIVNGVPGFSRDIPTYLTTQYTALRELMAREGRSTNVHFPDLYEWVLKKGIHVKDIPTNVTLAHSPLNGGEGPVKVYIEHPNPNFVPDPQNPYIDRSVTQARRITVHPTNITSRYPTSLNIGKNLVEDNVVILEQGKSTKGRDLVEFAALQPYIKALVSPELTQS